VWEVVRISIAIRPQDLMALLWLFFFQKCWEVLEVDIMAVLRSFTTVEN